MAKKKGYRPKGPIQIIASIVLVIAILWTAKGLFQAGGAGYKEIKNKVSSSSKYPVLNCISDDNGKDYVDIIDLQKIFDKQPSKEELKTLSKRPNISYVWMYPYETDYFVLYKNNSNGISTDYSISIMRDTGVATYSFFPEFPVTATISDKLARANETKTYTAICEEIKRKKL